MVKRVLITILLIFLLSFCVLACLGDYPRDVTFSCSKRKNICTYSSSTYLFKRKSVETIEFDKIIKSYVKKNISIRNEDISSKSYLASPTTYYYYDWIIYYKNNGKIDTFAVFRTSEYESAPAYELLDEEYRYYLDTTKVFNSFLEDNSKYSIYIPEYSDNSAKERDFWWGVFIYSIMLTQIILYTYMFILCLFDTLERWLPEGKIKQILTCIGDKLI